MLDIVGGRVPSLCRNQLIVELKNASSRNSNSFFVKTASVGYERIG